MNEGEMRFVTARDEAWGDGIEPASFTSIKTETQGGTFVLGEADFEFTGTRGLREACRKTLAVCKTFHKYDILISSLRLTNLKRESTTPQLNILYFVGKIGEISESDKRLIHGEIAKLLEDAEKTGESAELIRIMVSPPEYPKRG